MDALWRCNVSNAFAQEVVHTRVWQLDYLRENAVDVHISGADGESNDMGLSFFLVCQPHRFGAYLSS